MKPTIVDIGWLAGFLEGEGYFGYGGSKKYPTIAIQLVSTDKDVLEKVVDLFGGRIIQRKNTNTGHNVKGKPYKAIYSVSWYSDRAAAIAMTVFPLMGTRRQTTIKNILDLWKYGDFAKYRELQNIS
jgi:hypothetical protein